MKKIGILVPCFNEQENVAQIAVAIENELKNSCSKYDYEICFIDNCSTDKTRSIIRELCKNNTKIKAILNARNFGQFNSPVYGMMQLDVDCIVLMCCDFQDPIEMLPKLVAEWENGAKIVATQKIASKENKVIRFLRTCYYKTIKKMSEIEQIEHFTGFGLYDKDFIQILKALKDPTPFLRSIVAELGFKVVKLKYTQAKRRAGKTHNNFFTLFDGAMLSFTSYTKVGLRVATYFGFTFSFLSFVVGMFYLIRKFIYWDTIPLGTAPIIVGTFFIGSLQIFFIGFLGEYIMNINQRIMNRPLVIEEERLNF